MPTVNRRRPNRRGAEQPVELMHAVWFSGCIEEIRHGRPANWYGPGTLGEFWRAHADELRDICRAHGFKLPADVEELLTRNEEAQR